MDEKMSQLLKDLGTAIYDCVDSDEKVDQCIKAIRDAGYDIYIVLDATVNFTKLGDEPEEAAVQTEPPHNVEFKIGAVDCALLHDLGIDPAGQVKSSRKIVPLARGKK